MSKPLTTEQLDAFRTLAKSVTANDAGAAMILALLDEVDRLKNAFIPRPLTEVHWLTKDFHVLYRTVEQLVADLDAEKLTGLGYVKAQIERLRPAFEECEVARRMAQSKREG